MLSAGGGGEGVEWGRGGLAGGEGSGRGWGQGIFQSSCHILHYYMVLRPEGTSHKNMEFGGGRLF